MKFQGYQVADDPEGMRPLPWHTLMHAGTSTCDDGDDDDPLRGAKGDCYWPARVSGFERVARMQRDEPEGGGPWRLQKHELEGTRESCYNNAKTGGESKLLLGIRFPSTFKQMTAANHNGESLQPSADPDAQAVVFEAMIRVREELFLGPQPATQAVTLGLTLSLVPAWRKTMYVSEYEERELQEEEAINLELQEEEALNPELQEEALNQGLSDISLLQREGGQLMPSWNATGGAEGRADQRVSAGPLSNTTGGVAILSSPTAVPHVADPLSPPVYDGNSDEHGDDIHGRNLFDGFFDENSDGEEYPGVYY
jgi:hypothetical protein